MAASEMLWPHVTTIAELAIRASLCVPVHTIFCVSL